MTEVSDQTATTAEVVERLRAAMESGQPQDFIAQFAEDAVYETPFELAGRPSRWEGFQAVSEHLGAENPTKQLLEFNRVTVETHLGADPEVVTAQFTIAGKVLASGEQFVLPSSIGIIQVRDGKIVRYQDYTNTLRGAQLAGVLKHFAASLAAAAE
ncbi:nuclear transport factor 2 family protein [Actinokineospora inagensis]|uniref:nuclear transport factor 2 family protein n=1 Tax=Actinokineospora inagensis TaxID=103730 RepID=UPI0004043F96|nr:nuclear transport factor 2 family protein [Actinokineospora inagensis]